MSKQEFLDELKIRLVNIPEAERSEALCYYEDYFADAGEENEAQVIEALGSPQKVADQIKAAYRGQNIEDGEFTETGYNTEYDKGDIKELAIRKKKYGIWTILIVIAVIVLTFTVLIPALGGLFGGLIGLIMGILGILFSIAIAGIAGVVVGALMLVSGIFLIPADVPVALIIMGASLICMGIGSIITTLGFEVVRHTIPPTCKWVCEKFNWLSNKFRKKRA